MDDQSKTQENDASENKRSRAIAAVLDGDRRLDAELFTAMQSELNRPSPRTWPMLSLVLLPLSAAVVLGLHAITEGRTPLRFDLNALPARGWIGYAVQCACIVGAGALIAYRNPRGFGLSSSALRWTAWILAALVGLTPLLMRGEGPQPLLHAFGAPCALIVAISGALALTLAASALRHSQPIAAEARAAVLGAATAAWVGLVISLHCPGESFVHLLWGHSVPMTLMLPLAALLLPRFLRP